MWRFDFAASQVAYCNEAVERGEERLKANNFTFADDQLAYCKNRDSSPWPGAAVDLLDRKLSTRIAAFACLTANSNGGYPTFSGIEFGTAIINIPNS